MEKLLIILLALTASAANAELIKCKRGHLVFLQNYPCASNKPTDIASVVVENNPAFKDPTQPPYRCCYDQQYQWQTTSQPVAYLDANNNCDSILAKQKAIYANKYPNNYHMQEILIKGQCKSYLFLQSYKTVPGIPDSKITELKKIYASKYPDNYHMQEILIKGQVKAYLELHK